MAFLRDIAKISSGQSAPQNIEDYCNDGITFIKASDLDAIIEDDNELRANKITEEAAVRGKLCLFPKGTVVFAKSGMSCLKNRVYVIKEPSYVVNHLCCVYNLDKDYDVDWLALFIKFYDVTGFIRDKAYPSISLKDIAGIWVPKVDKSVQIETRNIIHSIQHAIDLKRKQMNDLDELVKSKFQEMFGDVMLSESKWEQTTFGKEFDICSGGTPSTSKKEYWDNGNISWIGSNMCQDWIIYQNDGKFITKEGLDHSSAKLLEPGTVLVALVGATIGKTALLRFRTTTNQNVAAIKVNDNTDYYPEFVFYLLQGLYGKFMNYSNGKFAMANLSFVRDLPLIKPQKSLQGEFVDFVEKVNSLKGVCEREIFELNELLESKMDEYFGEKE